MSYQISEEISWRKLGEHTIILDTTGRKQIHHLNEIGSLIWQDMQNSTAPNEIISHILKSYDVTVEEASQDLNDFFDKLRELQIIQ